MSGPSSETTIQQPSPQDIELQNLNISAAKKQSLGMALQYALASPNDALSYLDAIKAGQGVSAGLQTIFGGLEGLDNDSLRNQLKTQAAIQKDQQTLQGMTTKNAIKYATGDISLTPQQQSVVDQAFAGPEAQAKYDLNLAMQGNAGARGLNLSDSPIANENARQNNLLNLNFGSAKANAALNLGLSQENANLAYNQFTAGLNPGSYNTLTTAQGYMSPNLASGMSLGLQSRMANVNQNSNYGGLDYAKTGAQAAAGIGAAFAMSDRRMKSNVKRIGTHPLGIGIYEYTIYGKRERGVMADEVLLVKPSAIMVNDDGYYMIDYSQLY